MGVVLVHGGAGAWPDEHLDEGVRGAEGAAEAGAAELDRGALAAAVAAVINLERNPIFNAGYGATLTREGRVELDAAVMTGDLRFGAVGGCPPVESAVRLALEIYEDGEYALLVGQGALEFALERGMTALDESALVVDRQREKLEKERARRAAGDATIGTGTVGAVAVDDAGTIAAATSTGGILYKRTGRVGDTPLPGCGTYADDAFGGAASATGRGESILRTMLTREAVGRLGISAPADAAQRALEILDRRAPGPAGLIIVDREGKTAAIHNTIAMPWAEHRSDGTRASGT